MYEKRKKRGSLHKTPTTGDQRLIVIHWHAGEMERISRGLAEHLGEKYADSSGDRIKRSIRINHTSIGTFIVVAERCINNNYRVVFTSYTRIF